MIDITNIPPNNRVYNGTTKKYGVTIDNVDYIVKFPKGNDMSVYCEYIASNIIRLLGIECHEVFLVKCNNVIVDLIKDFTSGSQYSLHSYKDTKQSSEDTDIDTKEYTYNDILYLMDKHLKMDDTSRIDAKRKFWTMFICDAIMGNRDRHWGNWGYITNGNGNYRFAPLYDNGAGLFPGVMQVINEYTNTKIRKSFLYDRIFVFPASLFKIKRPDRSYRSNYAEMFKDLRVNKIFGEEVLKFKNNISYTRLFEIAHSVCNKLMIPPQFKRFYIEIVTLRYMCIVLRMNFDKAYIEVERGLKQYGY